MKFGVQGVAPKDSGLESIGFRIKLRVPCLNSCPHGSTPTSQY